MANPDRQHKYQLLLKYPRDMLVTTEGYEPRYPHPNGFSGCGVWRVTPRLPDQWTTNDRKLVGVEHTHGSKKQVSKATRIEAVVKLLAEGYPELVPSIEAGLKASGDFDAA
jgi:hypothetical protein